MYIFLYILYILSIIYIIFIYIYFLLYCVVGEKIGLMSKKHDLKNLSFTCKFASIGITDLGQINANKNVYCLLHRQ